ncbi:MAG: hypothetical protein LBM59_01905 [Ruminococcus sp.]|jgi:type II pantothenate kinase|nr:hypothetical protein [Ruminococcus sp.]
MVICGVDAGLSDTKYCYKKDGKFVFTNVKPPADIFVYTGINAAEGEHCFPEFDCVVAGARELTGLSEFLLVSMGTGTAFLRVTPDSYTHLGGSGFGNGTIKGLCRQKGFDAELPEIAALAKKGKLNAVDLQIRDVLENTDESLLAGDVTASNLYKLSPQTDLNDFAAGILNLTAESLLMMAVFARRNIEKIVCIGGVSNLEAVKLTAGSLEKMHKISFIFPENAAFAGAIGCLIKSKLNLENIIKGES